MGKITHADIGTQLTKTEWEANTTHLDSQGNTLELSRSATLVVAASDASAKSKAGADYVCDSKADDVEIQAAIDALPAGGGKVVLSEGTFTLSTSIDINRNYVSLVGQGRISTTLKAGGNFPVIIISSQRVKVADLALDGNNQGANTHGFEITYSQVIAENIDVFRCQNGVHLKGPSLWQVTFRDMWIEECVVGFLCPDTVTDIDVYLYKVQIYQPTLQGLLLRKTNHVVLDTVEVNGSGKQGLHIVDRYAGGFFAINCVFEGVRDLSAIASVYIATDDVHLINCWADSMGTTTVLTCTGSRLQILGGRYASAFWPSATNPQDIILLSASVDSKIIGAHIGLYGDYTGIMLSGSERCVVEGNTITGGGTNALSVEEVGATNANIITNNRVEKPITKLGALSIVRGNVGYITENSDTATVADGTTSIAVTHGLATTPTRVQITPRENPTNAVAFWWVDTLTPTQFTINVNTNPGASGLDFDWRAVVGEGN